MKKVALGVALAALLLAGVIAYQWWSQQETGGDGRPLRGAASYTPYDAHAMLWTRGGEMRDLVWVSSGAEAGNLVVSQADPARRPDWGLCTQGVVAGLAAKGERVVILAT